jgi:S-formylglutathione hydrolase FrmB
VAPDPKVAPHPPLLVFLHGRGADENSSVGEELFQLLALLGRAAPAIAFPYGGDHSYWHDRRGGAWAKYVMREVIPLAERRLHADRGRIAIGGISMGGFGAYDLARLDPGRFCAVGGHSPALFGRAEETAAGAFDGASDFARNDVIGIARRHPSLFRRAALWLDAGTADPFDAGDRAFVAALRRARVAITVHRWPGSHTPDYWSAHFPQYLGFYASALARCTPRPA